MPSYSNIFQPETSFCPQITDLENEEKNCLIPLVIAGFFPIPKSN